ncbi:MULTISPECIES: pantetheine-phosphate adenylyltransferase [Sphingomonadaceae]|jgi:pantetheine-phosphate adenylyltransferase|uniref:Phosphopantetheine adenylyltransferase n=1 Tax=Novosphingobium resinovorum TaxID=158500 RepID=A0A031K4P1_9SPHN|nr:MULTISPECIES: pantetheine-phosphate adenylyltransferase [Sphingomonadaceae]AOR75900.1 pantetheine-phosphate adenylyltransferase [Novosphingobium resinovorum]EJU12351.1 phosphopantetheine adenylyltransferase [Sphingomonas sp. LH128]EZP84906.1 Phosphopantetheine adenylyltransferase [Novosphingobium resinovorum]MBF7011272.1 pantetheine-phosphate adenylyltransferase [Novosphingobium sp. HR1a]WJM29254.1 pantetheine-phosphate adenylyltransferase [Novosphingobium resinovorum]
MASAERIGVYPGTFDPITLGHADIIRRGAKLVDKLIIGVTTNPSKNPLFTPDERMAMVEREVAAMGIDNVSVVGFNALLMKFAQKQGASVIVRGLRAVADFEYEYQMAGMNQQLNSTIETVFLMADVSLQPIASKLVKEIAMFGGDIVKFVSPAVREDVVGRIAQNGLLGDY